VCVYIYICTYMYTVYYPEFLNPKNSETWNKITKFGPLMANWSELTWVCL